MGKRQKDLRKKPMGLVIAGHLCSALGRLILTVVLIGIITGSIFTAAVTIYVVKFVKPYDIDLSRAKLKFSSIVYANDPSTGKPVQIAQLSGEQNRIWIDLADIPQYLKDAVISVEDQRFMEHDGVDLKRTVSAMANLVFHFYDTTQGGSTLTQQLIKNLEGNVVNRTIPIKAREIITALDVEKKYSKDQILECYLNTIDLGNNCYGVQTAANLYFGKNVQDLDLAQCAVLAGITKSPQITYNPYRHPENVKARQQRVLSKMLQLGKISQKEYDAAIKEEITYKEKKASVHSWFVDQVFNDVVNDLMEQKGFTQNQARTYVYTQGLQIYTTEDPQVQAGIEKIYTDDKNWRLDKDGNKYQSAMVIMDYDGQIKGVVGGRGQKTQNLLFDRTKAIRQPGSAIKPIAVYGPAIEYNLINWSSIFKDSPPIVMEGEPWPVNDGGSYSNRNLTVAEGLGRSLNTIAARVDLLLTPQKSYDFLIQRLGITTLVKNEKIGGKIYSDDNIWIAIGSITRGLTPVELAAAYQPFGNGGRYTRPYTYTKVLDAEGNVILQNKPVYCQAFSPETATIVNKLLQNNVNAPYGTGTAARISGYQVGGKTGTTTGSVDRWFVGITPDYVGVVWTGYDDNKGDLSGRNPAVDAWAKVMKSIPLKTKKFPVWGNVVTANYDPNTGAITPGQNTSYVGWYKADDPALTAPASAPSAGQTEQPGSAAPGSAAD